MTDTDTFKIDFPDNIDVTTKAILMGATMLVVSYPTFLKKSFQQFVTHFYFQDFMYFEKQNNNHD